MQALSDRHYWALAEFRYQLRRFLRRSEEAARATGLEPQQHQLLLAIRGLPEGRDPTIGQLAERLQLQHHSLVGLIDRLERRGLVRRERAAADRRRVHVYLTEEGERALRELSMFHWQELQSIGPGLVRALQRIVAPASRRRGGRHAISQPPGQGDDATAG
ncbi:Transcriptional regulator HosA [bacterium HR24]|nr:Transcriptional regulator HosA [bacterium HR24]